ncbi:MAG: prepilin-type N-terminal cleavage/methylation domain-containing protein [Candidatus Omnitrophota bacterium]
MNRIKKLKLGFTMVELLMVVVVIGTLVTILYPSYQGFILRGRLKEIIHTVPMIVAAERYYNLKEGSYFHFDRGGNIDGHNYRAAEVALNIIIPPGRPGLEFDVTYEADLGFDPLTGVRDDEHVVVRAPSVNVDWLYYWSEHTRQSYKNGAHPYSRYITADNTQ